MKSPTLSLARKNFRQHYFVLGAACLFGLVYVGALVLASELNGRVLSHLSLTPAFAKSGLLLVALIFGQRLITNEYYGRTQRFLESLPVRRVRVVWSQYNFGLVALLLVMAIVWGTLTWFAAVEEPISSRFIGLMLARWASYTFALWGVVFVFALLGRLRLPLAALTATLAYLVLSNTSLEFDRFGPLALMDSDLFAFERHSLPALEIAVTLAIGVVLLIAGMFLAGLREGSFVESLAHPMGVREKGFLLGLVVMALGAAVLLQPEPPVEPFEFTDKRVLRKGAIEVSYLEPGRAGDAERLANYLHQRIARLNKLIVPRSANFKLRVGFNPSLDARDFRTGLNSSDQGVVAYTNFANHPDWDLEYFGSYVFHQWIAANANQELSIEEGHWLLDGFSRWWASHGDTPAPALSGELEPLIVEALYSMRGELPDVKSLEQWDRTTQLYGEIQAMTVAYFGWRVLADMRGHTAVVELARDEFNRLQYHDVRDWWRRFKHPVEARFAKLTGVSLEVFVEEWQRRAKELMNRADYASALAALPVADLNIEPVVSPNGGLGLRYQLELVSALPVDTRCVALHQPLGPYDVPLGRGAMREIIIGWPAAPAEELGESARPLDETTVRAIEYDLAIGEYGSGTRVFVGFECRLAGVSTDVTFGQKMVVMP